MDGWRGKVDGGRRMEKRADDGEEAEVSMMRHSDLKREKGNLKKRRENMPIKHKRQDD